MSFYYKLIPLTACLFGCGQNGSSVSTQGNSSAVVISNPINGFQVLPKDNAWNTDISGYPVHTNSSNYINSMGLSGHVHPDFGTEWEGAPIGIPYAIVDAHNTPLLPINFEYADESDTGPYPIPADVPIEGGNSSDGDRHILLVDTTASKLYELWHAYPPGHAANPSKTQWYAGSGVIFDLSSNTLRPNGFTSADAAGLPIFPGLARYDEAVTLGAIHHALRFTAVRTQKAYIHPATHQAGASTDANLPPMGLRVRLKASFDTTGYSPEVRTILLALKTYGMLLADNGSNWYISGAPDSRWNDEHLAELSKLQGQDFEAVETGALHQ